MQVRYLSPAEWEMVQAARYYEAQVPKLGYDFLSEIHRAVKRIEDNPESAPEISGSIRRRLIRKFPYAILYQIDPAEIVILAIMHLHRDPDYWQGRK